MVALRRQTMHNVPVVDDDPLLANEPINDEDDDDYDDSMQMGDGFIGDDDDGDNGSAFVMAQMGQPYGDDDNSEVDTKDGILVGDSEDEMDARGFHPPPPPLVQMSVGDSFNGTNTVS